MMLTVKFANVYIYVILILDFEAVEENLALHDGVEFLSIFII